MTSMYENAVQPVATALPPHWAHHVGTFIMHRFPWKLVERFNKLNDPRLSVNLAGMALPSPVGSGAGLDKRCLILNNLLRLGFGFAVGGTITPEPHDGNPRPAIRYRRADRALVNSMGFPNDGMERSVARLAKGDRGDDRQWISISADEVKAFCQLYAGVQDHVGAVEINVSSPNRHALKDFQTPKALQELLNQLMPLKKVPTFVKLPRSPAATNAKKPAGAVLALAEAALNAGADGIVLANSLPVKEERLAVGAGGLTGAPLLQTTTQLVRKAYSAFGGDAVIIASGGISDGQQAWELLRAGASAIQVYTGMIYKGFRLPAEINGTLSKLLDRHGVASIAELRSED